MISARGGSVLYSVHGRGDFALYSVTYFTSFEKHLESSSGHTLSFYPNLVKYRFKNLFLKESLTCSSTMI